MYLLYEISGVMVISFELLCYKESRLTSKPLMRSWWGKSSSKDVMRKSKKERFIDTISRKWKIFTEEKSSGKSGSSRRRYNDIISEKGSQSRVSSSPSPSTPASCCQSFVDRTSSQPLPLPEGHFSNVHLVDSGNSASIKSVTSGDSKPSLTLPLPTPKHPPYGPAATGVDKYLPTASVSCDSDSDDPADSRLLSPQTSYYENGSRSALNSPSSWKQKVQSPIASKASPGEMLKSANLLSNNQWLLQFHLVLVGQKILQSQGHDGRKDV